LLVPDRERLQLIEAASIEWLEADDNYVQVHTAGRTYLLRRTLQDLLSHLGEQRFIRIHRSTAVNLGCIGSLTPSSRVTTKSICTMAACFGSVDGIARRYSPAWGANIRLVTPMSPSAPHLLSGVRCWMRLRHIADPGDLNHAC
jgi:hypothetical protein